MSKLRQKQLLLILLMVLILVGLGIIAYMVKHPIPNLETPLLLIGFSILMAISTIIHVIRD